MNGQRSDILPNHISSCSVTAWSTDKLSNWSLEGENQHQHDDDAFKKICFIKSWNKVNLLQTDGINVIVFKYKGICMQSVMIHGLGGQD